MSSSVAAKVDIKTGEVIWTNGTGIGPVRRGAQRGRD